MMTIRKTEVKPTKIKLKYVNHRGHVGSNGHPRNLFDGSDNTYYCSKPGVTNKDWIEFKATTDQYIIPSTIGIVNSCCVRAIKNISISIRDKYESNKYHKICELKDIDKSPRIGAWKEREYLLNLLVSEAFILSHSPLTFKLRINQHWGHSKYNEFYSLCLY